MQVQSLGWEDSPREENGSLLQYACADNPMDRGAWWATGYRVTKGWVRVSDYAHDIKYKVRNIGHYYQSVIFYYFHHYHMFLLPSSQILHGCLLPPSGVSSLSYRVSPMIQMSLTFDSNLVNDVPYYLAIDSTVDQWGDLCEAYFFNCKMKKWFYLLRVAVERIKRDNPCEGLNSASGLWQYSLKLACFYFSVLVRTG